MRTNGFRRDGNLSLNAHQIGGTTVYLGLVVRERSLPPSFPHTHTPIYASSRKKNIDLHLIARERLSFWKAHRSTFGRLLGACRRR